MSKLSDWRLFQSATRHVAFWFHATTSRSQEQCGQRLKQRKWVGGLDDDTGKLKKILGQVAEAARSTFASSRRA
jgi:hypothetical protein